MLQISLLGDQRLTLDGTSLLGSLARRSVEIVAYLALHPTEPQPRAQLSAALWPDSSDAQAMFYNGMMSGGGGSRPPTNETAAPVEATGGQPGPVSARTAKSK